MATKFEILAKHVSDMLALEKQIAETVDDQLSDKLVNRFPKAVDVLKYIHPVLKEHIAGLEGLSAHGDSGLIMDAVSTVSGLLSGLYGKLRADRVSKMLRDDYTALSLTAAAYSMLHTNALALRDPETAELAIRNLRSLTPLVVELSEVIPRIVVDELVDDQMLVDLDAPDIAARNTHDAWRIHNPHHSSVGNY